MAFQTNSYDPNNPQQQRPRRMQPPAQNPGVVAPQQGGSAVPVPPRPPRARQMRPQAPAQPNPAVAAPQANTQAPANFNQQYQNFASQGLANPSRYDQSTVSNTVNYINQALDKARADRYRDTDAFMAQRGTIGSSIEADERHRIDDSVAMERLKQLTDYQNTVAQTNAADRTAAASVAGQVASLNQRDNEFGQTMGFNREQLAQQGSQFDKSLAQDSTQFNATLGFNREQLAQNNSQFGQNLAQQDKLAQLNAALSREGMAQNNSQFGQTLAFNKEQAGSDNNFRQQQLAETQRQFNTNTGFQQQDIDLRAKQLQEQARQFGVEMTMQQAQFQAAQQLSRDQMGQQNAQFGQELGVRERELQSQDKLQYLNLALNAIAQGGGSGFSGGTGSSGGYAGTGGSAYNPNANNNGNWTRDASDPQWQGDYGTYLQNNHGDTAGAQAFADAQQKGRVGQNTGGQASGSMAGRTTWTDGGAWDQAAAQMKGQGMDDAAIERAIGKRPVADPYKQGGLQNAANGQVVTLDGKQYARVNNQWVEIKSQNGNTVTTTNGQTINIGTGSGGPANPNDPNDPWFFQQWQQNHPANQDFVNGTTTYKADGSMVTTPTANTNQNYAAQPTQTATNATLPPSSFSGYSMSTPNGNISIPDAPPGWSKVEGGWKHSTGSFVPDNQAFSVFRYQGSIGEDGKLTPAALKQIENLKTLGHI